MSAHRRTPRDERRRRLGQNFLRPDRAARFVDAAEVVPGELVLEIGAGRGALTLELARRAVDVLAIELDPVWVRELRARVRGELPPPLAGRVRVIEADFRDVAMPSSPFRVVGALPFSATTDILRKLLDRPVTPITRADLIVQWEVARKRAADPPTTLLSTVWAQWWEVRLRDRIPAQAFRPVPAVDAGVLTVTRRERPLLPPALAADYARFVRERWPFPDGGA